MTTVDLNADLGESFGRWSLGDDAAMLEVVTSANVACGFHAGDPTTLMDICLRAAASGVAVGAQVGYPDLAGFGRRFIDVSAVDLTADVVYQVGALRALARAAGTRVSYVKPHGALYNAIVAHEAQAAAVVEALVLLGDDLPLVGLPGSLSLRFAEEAGLSTVVEAFADRAYAPDGTLVPRADPGAVIHDPEAVAGRVVRLVVDGVVEAIDGSLLAVRPDSVCVHGDTAGAVSLATAVRQGLEAAGVQLRPFARPRGS
ncbi:5-oxoprolinase subunit PxpA [Pedococcus sp. KACC 23699]|uniref:5-oxoprolinase subunit A n=1 Tax=Pedococcus sp. KACC 23699 TaxID=3149228 RepID=A0AAU7JVH1_9MICO